MKATNTLAELVEIRGDYAQAARLHLDGLAAARRIGDPRAVALAYEGLAVARSFAGDTVHAAHLLGTATALASRSARRCRQPNEAT